MKVCFLPYVAGMWRSMAPLYQEHIEAGDDVSVMPIPYYGRDQDGELSYPHYDYGFPVPVKDYRETDLAAEHPDIIYYHYPYDDHNRVTSVDPAYYSYNIRKYCDKLIYTPYYTLAVDDCDAGAGCVSGIQCADAVITWSEKQRNNYAACLPRKEVIYKKRPKLEGSPVPEDWEERIAGRHVAFLNNSLYALINNPKRELEHLDKAIRGYRNMCLWWRPHPLFVDTIKALFPQYSSTYYQTMNRFLDRHDIYDDTWDVDRAAVRCHEYIGDPSSLERLFTEQGKKVTIL